MVYKILKAKTMSGYSDIVNKCRQSALEESSDTTSYEYDDEYVKCMRHNSLLFDIWYKKMIDDEIAKKERKEKRCLYIFEQCRSSKSKNRGEMFI